MENRFDGVDITDEWIAKQLGKKTIDNLIERGEKIKDIHLPPTKAKTMEERLAELRQNSIPLTKLGTHEGFEKGPVVTGDTRFYDDGAESVMESPFENEKYVVRLFRYMYDKDFVYKI